MMLLLIILIENEVAKNMNFDELMNEFAENESEKSYQSKSHLSKVLLIVANKDRTPK